MIVCKKSFKKWIPYTKGGRSSKWAGNTEYCVRWDDATRKYFREDASCRITEEEYWRRDGITYSATSGKGFAARYIPPICVYDVKGPAILPVDPESLYYIMAYFNSKFFSFVLTLLNPTLEIQTGDLERVPFLRSLNQEREILSSVGKMCVVAKERLVSHDPTEFTFDAFMFNGCKVSGIHDLCELSIDERLACETTLSLLQMAIDDTIASVIYSENVNRYTAEPSSVFGKIEMKLLKGYCEVMVLGQTMGMPNLGQILCELESQTLFELNEHEIIESKGHIRTLYENMDLTSDDRGDSNDEYNKEVIRIQSQSSFPDETIIGNYADRLQIHALSVYWLLLEGRKKEHWRCRLWEKETTGCYFSTLFLRILGHRWPKQIEANEPLSNWADEDGIIPLTDGTNEQTLLSRVRKRIVAEFEGADVASIEREFAEIIGNPLEQWLEIEFFKHHVRQFKKRPIAWQSQSGKYGRRDKPAFACLIYYHKLDGDLLPKIRTHYVGVLRERCETELRGIEALPFDARSDRQEKRRIKLETQIEELRRFDIKLKDLTESAFGPQRLISHLRQNALEDSMLCLKMRWLKKLSGIIQQAPLKEWIELAEQAELHEKLPEWIMEPVQNLHYFCSKVGADTPKEKGFRNDPGPRELAEIICSKAGDMMKGSLRLVCTTWWKNLDEAAFLPLRTRIKDLQEEVKVLKEKEAFEGKENPQLLFDFEMQIESLKVEMKTLRKELADKTEKAKRIRIEIESWSNADALTWEPWLAVQPMYDAISGIDGQHNPPGSIQDFIRQESAYFPDTNDGVRVNIAPLQKAGVLAADVFAKRDLDKAISDRAEWRADERRWCREGKLPQPGWWPEVVQDNT